MIAPQAARIQIDVEKVKAARRVGPLLAVLLPLLTSPASASASTLGTEAVTGEAELAMPQAAGGWQEVYYALNVVDRMAQHTSRQVCRLAPPPASWIHGNLHSRSHA